MRCVAAALAAVLTTTVGLAAQEPPPPRVIGVPITDRAITVDTEPRTAPPPPEDLSAFTPAPIFPAAPAPAPDGWASAVWSWDREELRRYHGLSLIELLERIPALTLTRSGGFGMPTGASVYGTGGGRIRIFLDGYELDPVEGPTPDLQHLAVVDVADLRVRRHPHEVRVEIDRLRRADREPFTEIEAGTGDIGSRALRAFFSRPILARNVLTLGLDLVDTGGLQNTQPFSATTGFLRLDHEFRPGSGLQFEYRQRDTDREQLFESSTERQDLVLRGRTRLTDALTAELVLGRSRLARGEPELGTDEAVSNQVAGRVVWNGGPVWAEGTARSRPGSAGARALRRELELSAGVRPARWLEAWGGVREAALGDVAGVETSGGVRLGPVAGMSFFADVRDGRRGVPVSALETPTDAAGAAAFDPTESFAIPSTARTARAGLEGGWGRLRGGAAAVRTEVDSIAFFGFPFDRARPPEAAETLVGTEMFLRTPLLSPYFTWEGWYVRTPGALNRPYLPTHQWRSALEIHGLFRDGNFEPTFWFELYGRSGARVPDTGDIAANAVVAPYLFARASLQLRVLDVRAFITVENAFVNQLAEDLPGLRRTPLPSAIFGARWQFFN